MHWWEVLTKWGECEGRRTVIEEEPRLTKIIAWRRVFTWNWTVKKQLKGLGGEEYRTRAKEAPKIPQCGPTRLWNKNRELRTPLNRWFSAYEIWTVESLRDFYWKVRRFWPARDGTNFISAESVVGSWFARIVGFIVLSFNSRTRCALRVKHRAGCRSYVISRDFWVPVDFMVFNRLAQGIKVSLGSRSVNR